VKEKGGGEDQRGVRGEERRGDGKEKKGGHELEVGSKV